MEGVALVPSCNMRRNNEAEQCLTAWSGTHHSRQRGGTNKLSPFGDGVEGN